MQLAYRSRRTLFTILLILVSGSLAAQTPRFGDRLLEQIREAEPGDRGISDLVVLPTGEEATIELEGFDVYAPGAVIEAIGEYGEMLQLPRPDVRYFRGSVDADPDSLVFLAVGKRTQGFMTRGDRKYRLRSVPPEKQRSIRGELYSDILIEEVGLTEEMPDGEPWTCEVDDFPMRGPLAGDVVASAMQHVRPESLTSPTATYVLNIAVEGDYELYLRQGSNSTATATYLANLVAATSVIYKRDLQTELRISYSGHHTASADPFTIDPANGGSMVDALLEFGKRWVDSPPSGALRSGAILVSGKDLGSGIAWVGTICSPNFPYNSGSYDGWGGAYGILLDAGLTTNFNPDQYPNYQADNDVFGFEYWPVLVFAHELGHVVQSSHTHCISLTSEEKSTFSVTRNYVDECYSDEGTGCYDDPDVGGVNDPSRFPHAVNANLPAELGTVMSYCHLTTGFPLGYGAATRYTFGQPNEPSIKVVNAMKAAIDAASPSLTTSITAPSSASSGTAANASITLAGGLSYVWSISNGVINSGVSGSTGGGGTFVVNFTGSADPVKLTITVTNTAGCSASDYVNIPYSALSLAAPTNVVATATTASNVALTWNASVSATGYQIHRSSDGLTFVQVGTTAGTAFNDPTATANAAYLYRVRATAGSDNSPFSAPDLATTVIFTDPTLTVGVTTTKAVHFTEIRTAVNAVRTLAGLSPAGFTDPVLNAGVTARAVHLTELRSNLDAARSPLGLSALSYSDVAPLGVTIKAVHLNELRNGVR